MAHAEFEIVDHGSLVGFTPLTEEACSWWADHVQDGPSLGPTFYVEHRFAGPIIDGLREAGF